jgi:hypothetical protein
MPTVQAPDQVDDPVGHISISGIHGRNELDKHITTARNYDSEHNSRIGAALLGAAIGAALMYLLRR